MAPAAEARLLLLAVPDREIAPLAATLAADRGIDWRRRTVLHHAGALGLEPLAPLGRAGAAVGMLHPLQCLGRSRLAAGLLAGSRARVEAAGPARRIARRLARDVGLVPLELPGRVTQSDRTAYHAAAALVSNDLLALLGIGIDLLQSVGLRRREALSALLPLIRGTLVQAERGGLGDALSGPAARGDLATLEAHLKRLDRLSPDAADAHRSLSLRLLALARTEGQTLPPSLRRQLRDLKPRRS